jgi:hypothetical protein
MLAWARTTCRKVGVALYVRDLASGAQRVISIPPDVEVAPLAWAPDDRHLLVATFTAGGQRASILDAGTASSTNDAVRLQESACKQQFPRFLPDATFVALTCSPIGGTSGDALADFDPVSGLELRILQERIPLPSPNDAVFNVIVSSFSASPSGESAIWTTVPDVANRQSNVWRWSDGRAEQLPAFASEVAW